MHKLFALHLRQDPTGVVLSIVQMHQLMLICGFKNGVTHQLPMGEQTQTPLALSRFYGGIVVPSMTTLGAEELDRYCFADPLMASYYLGNGSPNLGSPTSLARKTGA